MSYLAREIFEFEVDWAVRPRAEWDYDLREFQVGFGAPSYQRLQTYTLHKFEFQFRSEDPALTGALEDFIAARTGNLDGFWLPSPFVAVTITNGVSTTVFDITDQGLADAWDSYPALDLRFTRDGVAQHARVSGVTDLGNGKERVTLSTALGTAVDATWEVNRLLYVRFADDKDEVQFGAEHVARWTLKVVELPLEYTTAETAQKPIWLIRFWVNYEGTPVSTRWTTHRANVTSQSVLYTSAPIEISGLSDSMRTEREDVTLKCSATSGNPLLDFLPGRFERPVNVEIIEVQSGALDTQVVWFTGQVNAPQFKGREITCKCSSFLDVLNNRLFGMMIQARCNYEVFDTATCKKNPTAFQITGAITAIAGAQVTFAVAAAFDVDWFALGWLRTVAGGGAATIEVRGVLQSTADAGGEVTLQLDRPLRHAIVGQDVYVRPGCDGLRTTCMAKFDNFVNFGGHPVIPVDSPSVNGLPTQSIHGNKK